MLTMSEAITDVHSLTRSFASPNCERVLFGFLSIDPSIYILESLTIIY